MEVIIQWFSFVFLFFELLIWEFYSCRFTSILNLHYYSIFLGLKLLTVDIQGSTDPKDVERNDTLCDINSACRTALDILNDLLCFDKLESGILELHKEEVPVLPYLFDCVAMFSSQARVSGVNLSITNIDVGIGIDSTLMETDTVTMDKFKMDQVLRNLISNAVKFTPSGGDVTVSAAFIANEEENIESVEKRDSLRNQKSFCSVVANLWNSLVRRCAAPARIYVT